MIKHECINNLNARPRHFIVRDAQKPGTIKTNEKLKYTKAKESN